eukprot:7246466-Prymnesium_polylepis.1
MTAAAMAQYLDHTDACADLRQMHGRRSARTHSAADLRHGRRLWRPRRRSMRRRHPTPRRSCGVPRPRHAVHDRRPTAAPLRPLQRGVAGDVHAVG